MKLENILALHLYNAKSLTLQGIGKFELSPDFVPPMEGDKEYVMPENAVSFAFDNKAKEDETLVAFIVQQTKKIKPLASADLDSYLTLGKQFLNIGKPFKIEGIGSLEKNQSGEYFFTQGQYMNQKVETTSPNSSIAKDNNAGPEISFASKPKEKKSNKKLMLAIGAGILIPLLVWAGYYLFLKFGTVQKSKEPEKIQAPVSSTPNSTNTTNTDTLKQDSTSKAPTTLPIATNANGFDVIIKEYNTLAKANDRADDLKKAGHNVSVFTTDSIKYKITLNVSKPLSDSTYVIDSLRRFFGGKPVIKN